jgi:predicted NAD-dependent protein-ADP-ribosyltransferase YbiA (DUF1768 family)
VNLQHGWERVKKPVMPRIVLAKFGQDGELGRLLRGTGDAAARGDTWHDQYWGDCRCKRPSCRNYLGAVPEAVRLVLRED